ncbi:MAG: type IV pilus modification protein PilV [Nitrospiraceae bacterium]
MNQQLSRLPDGKQGGFTLIEALVSLFLLTIGLLGLAAMQSLALSGNVDANELSLATNLASDMLERIRYNDQNVTAYNGIDTQVDSTKPPTTQAMARGDYEQWDARLGNTGLSGVQGLVTVTAQGPAQLNQQLVTVRVNWTNRSRGGGVDTVRQSLNHSVIISTTIVPQ